MHECAKGGWITVAHPAESSGALDTHPHVGTAYFWTSSFILLFSKVLSANLAVFAKTKALFRKFQQSTISICRCFHSTVCFTLTRNSCKLWSRERPHFEGDAGTKHVVFLQQLLAVQNGSYALYLSWRTLFCPNPNNPHFHLMGPLDVTPVNLVRWSLKLKMCFQYAFATYFQIESPEKPPHESGKTF